MVQTIGRIRQTLVIPKSSEERFIPVQDPACRTLQGAGVDMAGASVLRKGFICDRGGVWVHLLLYTVSGEGALQHVPGARRLRPGSLLVAPAWTHYAYTPLKVPWQIVWFHLSETSAWNALCGQEPYVRRSYLTQEVHDTVHHLLRESLRHDSNSYRVIELYSELLTVQLAREMRSEDTAQDRHTRQRLDGLWNTVSASLDEEWTVDRLARAIGMSTSHLHQVSRRYTDHTPMQMVTLLRMRRAEGLLVNYDSPLAVVAERVGYSTPYAFSAAFKRHTGLSPGSYRAGKAR